MGSMHAQKNEYTQKTRRQRKQLQCPVGPTGTISTELGVCMCLQLPMSGMCLRGAGSSRKSELMLF